MIESSPALIEDFSPSPADPPAPLEESVSAPQKPKMNMPVILTAACPGLGHLLYGAPVRGVIYLLITFSIFIFAIVFSIQAFMDILNGQSPVKHIVFLALVLIYGILFTAKAMYEASRLGAAASAACPKPAEGQIATNASEAASQPSHVGRVMVVSILGEFVLIAFLMIVIIHLATK